MTGREDLFKSIAWGLYKEHIKKFSHAAVKGEPPLEVMRETFLSILPECRIKILGQEKNGMIVQFHHLDTFPASDLASVTETQDFLANRYGGGKFKINLYHLTNFMSTKNYETAGPVIWKGMIKEELR